MKLTEKQNQIIMLTKSLKEASEKFGELIRELEEKKDCEDLLPDLKEKFAKNLQEIENINNKLKDIKNNN